MKKILSLVLVLSMVLGSFGFAFASNEAAGMERVVEAGAFGVGGLRLNDVATRAELATIVLRLHGYTDEAIKALNEKADFTDVPEGHWAAPFVGLAAKEGLFQGYGNGFFGPADSANYAQLMTVMLRSLGYGEEMADLAWPNGFLVKAAAVGIEVDFSIDPLAPVKRQVVGKTMEQVLDVNLNGQDTTLADKLGIEPKEPVDVVPATLEVKSIEANTAKSFLVTFNKPVEDTAKFDFTVKRGTATTTITTKWNDAKTEATLEASAKLPEGIFTITVTDKTGEDAVEMAKVEREITKEKIVSVDFDSEVITRISDTHGVVGFTTRNQYGEDITDTPLGRGLNWITSTKDHHVEYKSGVIEFRHDTEQVLNELKDLKSVVVTVRDTTASFVATKTFSVSDTVSIVSDIKVNGIVDEKGNEVKFIFNAANTYYLDFEAYDGLGKLVTYQPALDAKVYGTEVFSVRSTNTIVTPKLEKHPDTGKAAIRLELDGAATVTYDTPISFILMAPFTGKTATFNATLSRSARVEKFSLQSPVETATEGRRIEIPFSAFDQDGKEVTQYDDLKPFITFSPKDDIEWVRQSDGSAKLTGKFNKGMVYITATVDGTITGSFSQISIDVKEASVPSSITALRHTIAFTYNGDKDKPYDSDEASSWSRRLSHFTVKDQFDRNVNLRVDSESILDGTAFEIRVKSSSEDIIRVEEGHGAVKDGDYVILTGNTDNSVTFRAGKTTGTATITYELWGKEKVDNGYSALKRIDSATTIAYNVKPEDIRKAKITTDHDRDLFVVGELTRYGNKTALTATKLGDKMVNEFSVLGVLNNGMEVRLPSTMRAGYTSSNTNFKLIGDDLNQVQVISIGSATTASTTVTGYVYGKSGVLAASTEIKASTVAPTPTAVNVSYSEDFQRAANIDNDIITISASDFNALVVDKNLLSFDKEGNELTEAGVRFRVNTQYGLSNSGVVERLVVSQTGASNVNISLSTGLVTLTGGDTTPNTGEFTITAIAANGQQKVIKIVIK
ncbi:S-layer homology domain-containing protein [Alkaliphilus peptidifermentans]|uniref:S-layer homology domain-containing protein n=1 Tax=Alkaliphilus peptidifermentans DSM 18978 TaxID=1120976 RepID=A0A1G5AIN1_9FIRM|nr:S-layer homology domain-containing protein [Alkaliphilus peptidifermentans]SCX77717.1 S-layer homology domain-containing protein [Alkaliphilus peptidifermentans DSM 18978]